MDKDSCQAISKEVLDVIANYDCSFSEAKTVLMSAIDMVGAKKIKF